MWMRAYQRQRPLCPSQSNAISFGQKVLYSADGRGRVHGQLGRAMERTFKAVGFTEGISAYRFFGGEVSAGDSVGRATFGKLAEKASSSASWATCSEPHSSTPHTGSMAELEPLFSAFQCAVVIVSGNLTDWPDHPKVANRCTLRNRRAIEQNHGAAPPGRLPGKRQPDDASATTAISTRCTVAVTRTPDLRKY